MDKQKQGIITMTIKGITLVFTTSIRDRTKTETANDTREITTQEPTTAHQTMANKATATIATNQMVASK